MRTIKFRAWDRSRSDWHKFDNSQGNFEEEADDHATKLRIEDVTIWQGAPNLVFQQFTGLLDINGAEVFEGDLFGVNNLSGELEAVGEVIFDSDLAQFTIKYTNGGWAELWQHLGEKTNKAKEVIGNIYENEELLK